MGAFVFSGLLAGGMLTACDRGPYRVDEAYREPLRVTGVNFGAFDGGAPIAPPADGTLRIAFSSPLDPGSIAPQSIALLDKAGNATARPSISYDPVAKVVTLANPSAEGRPWLLEGTFSSVRFDGYDQYGSHLRAVDGAPIASGALGFVVGPAAGGEPAPPVIAFCTDILPVLRARCGGETCHGTAPHPAMGLILDTPEGITRTAVNRVAASARTGANGESKAAPRVFGDNMCLVRPFAPGESWLLYKVLLGDAAASSAPIARAARCDGSIGPEPTVVAAPAGVPFGPWSAADRSAVGTTVTGSPMPFPTFDAQGHGTTPNALTVPELQRMSEWIRQGARVESCPACVP